MIIPVARSARLYLVTVFSATLVATALGLGGASSMQAATTCERTFLGDATGSRDVTASLTSFIRGHGNKRLCLKSDGVYRVDGIVRIEDVSGLRLNGRGATLKQVSTTTAGTNRRHLYLLRSTNIYIHDLRLHGRNQDATTWIAAREHEPGIWIDGGSRITIRNVAIRGTYGDGVLFGFKGGDLQPPTNIKLDRLNIARAGRSGISITAGNYIEISNTIVTDTALHGINLEPDYAAADIHHVTVRNSTINRVQRAGFQHGYAFAANGKVGDMTDLVVRDSQGSRFEATVFAKPGYTHRNITFVRNRSGAPTTARFGNIVGLSFDDNVNIKLSRTNVR